MISEKVKSLYNNLSKLNKFATNKKWINIIFFGTWTLVAIGVLIMIVGLSLNNINKTTKLILAIFGISFAFLSLVLYYTYEFLRRKAINKIIKEFNFINIYNDYLKDKKVIDTNIVNMNQLKDQYAILHAKYAKMFSSNLNISKKYGIYQLSKKHHELTFSYFVTNELGYKKNVNYYLEIIFDTKLKNKNSYNLLITKKNKLLEGNHGYSNRITYQDFDVFYNTTKDLNFAKKLITKYRKELLLMNFDLQIDNQYLLVYCIKNVLYLLLDVSEFKFYRYEIDRLFDNVDNDINNFIELKELIDKMVCDCSKLKC